MPARRGAKRSLGPSVALVGLIVVAVTISPPAQEGASGSPDPGGTWVTHGPTTPRPVADLVMDPTDPDVLYAATTSPTKQSFWGVLKTTDGADTWSPAYEGITGEGQCGCVRNVLSLAIHPSQPGTLYAGTSRGVYATTDGATTWSGGGGPWWAYVAVDPFTPGTAYAAGLPPGQQTGNDEFVFKSTDGGETWTEIGGLTPTFGFRSLAADPFNPDTVYAGTASEGVFKTTDGGASWNAVNEGLSLGGSATLLADPVRTDRVYVGTAGGLFRTTDGGEHWLRLDIGSNGLPAGGYAPSGADPSRPDTIYVQGGGGLYRTTDAGATWTTVWAGGGGTIAASGSDLYAAGYGVYRSDDDGASWDLAIQGFKVESPVYSLAIDPSDPQRMYAGLDSNNSEPSTLYVSGDAGLTWRSVAGQGLPPEPWVDAVAVPPSRPGTIYLAAHIYQLVRVDQQEKMGVYKTTDYGETWSRVGPPIDPVDQAFFASGAPAYSLAVDPVNPDTLYVGGRGFVFKSTDGGATWLKLPVGAPEFDFIYAVAIDPSSPLNVYAGSGTAGFYKSVTGGLGWVPAMAGLTNRSVAALAIAPSDPDTVYAGTCCALSGQVGLYRSTDGGVTWSLTGLTKPIYSVVVDPSDAQRVYAGTSGEGIFASEDGGATWSEMNDGFPVPCPVHALAIDPAGSRIYAGAEYGQPGCSDGGVYVMEREEG